MSACLGPAWVQSPLPLGAGSISGTTKFQGEDAAGNDGEGSASLRSVLGSGHLEKEPFQLGGRESWERILRR